MLHEGHLIKRVQPLLLSLIQIFSVRFKLLLGRISLTFSISKFIFKLKDLLCEFFRLKVMTLLNFVEIFQVSECFLKSLPDVGLFLQEVLRASRKRLFDIVCCPLLLAEAVMGCAEVFGKLTDLGAAISGFTLGKLELLQKVLDFLLHDRIVLNK